MVKRFTNPKWNTRLALVTTGCVIFLGALTYHLCTFDYKLPTPGGTSVGAPLRLVVSVTDADAVSGARGVFAVVSLVNCSTSQVRLVDTAALMPLYTAKLTFHGGDGSSPLVSMTPAHMAASRTAAMEGKGFDPDKDTVVELVPGAALTRTIPLSALYELGRAGTYELLVTYEAAAVTRGSGPGLKELQAYEQAVKCGLSFELPFKKAPPPSSLPAAGLRVPPTGRHDIPIGPPEKKPVEKPALPEAQKGAGG